ncbi:MAG: hypothetical protein NUW37_02885 [Planctomycetes bacterium]|nr:hypothetical protein [Planctomycetota bacterium]
MKNKKFDCVEMKKQIQEKQLKLLDGLSGEARRKAMIDIINEDPVLAKLLREARRRTTPQSNRHPVEK